MQKKKVAQLIQLELTIDEVNNILELLGNQPFIGVYKLIEKIHLQAKESSEIGSQKSK
jgi:hypothetical protein